MCGTTWAQTWHAARRCACGSGCWCSGVLRTARGEVCGHMCCIACPQDPRADCLLLQLPVAAGFLVPFSLCCCGQFAGHFAGALHDCALSAAR